MKFYTVVTTDGKYYDHSEDVLNFIWIYDQYVQNLEDDEYPIPIDKFYYVFYKTQLIGH